ncbi:hypothetical protein TNCV_2487231 [Trichonephila clavipes]|uniref:Uncharacterized protein n=1 Tax=Trichonephila clavipes TaxID=2585209 RepID=A0A8X6VZY9_TRICX|nr:hypothetical protein TNCV_2487231 [Trichonephila clavipes]
MCDSSSRQRWTTRGKKHPKKIAELCCKFLPQPACTSHIEPYEHHLFRSLQKFLDGNNYMTNEGFQMTVEECFVSKTENSFFRGLVKQPKRRQTSLTTGWQPMARVPHTASGTIPSVTLHYSTSGS